MEKDIHKILGEKLNKILKKKFETLQGYDYLETIIDLKGSGHRHIQITPKTHTYVKEHKEDEEVDLFSNKHLL